MTEPAGDKNSGNFWTRRSKLSKGLIIGLVVIVVLAIAGALIPSEDSDEASAPNTVTVTETTEESDPAPVATLEDEPDTEKVTGRLNGRFHRDCFACGDLKQFIETSNAWCGWKGDTLVVHVTMTNDSAEHVTVTWHPSYTIARGSDHGTGLSSLQSDGFDSGETRQLLAEQHPEGVEAGARLSDCKPSFYLVESG